MIQPIDLIVTCPSCNKPLSAGTNWAGKTGICPHCQTTIKFPPTPPLPTRSSEPLAGFDEFMREQLAPGVPPEIDDRPRIGANPQPTQPTRIIHQVSVENVFWATVAWMVAVIFVSTVVSILTFLLMLLLGIGVAGLSHLAR